MLNIVLHAHFVIKKYQYILWNDKQPNMLFERVIIIEKNSRHWKRLVTKPTAIEKKRSHLGPAYIKSLATIFVITYTIYFGISILSHAFYSALFDTYRYLRRESPLATIIAPSDVSNNRSFPFRKNSIYLDWFCKSLKCNRIFLSLGATGFSLK